MIKKGLQLQLPGVGGSGDESVESVRSDRHQVPRRITTMTVRNFQVPIRVIRLVRLRRKVAMEKDKLHPGEERKGKSELSSS